MTRSCSSRPPTRASPSSSARPHRLPAQAFRRLANVLVGPMTQEPAPVPTLKGKRPLLRGLLGRS